MHVIIQAGGKGTRLENLTRNKPKCLVPINNKPLLFWAFEKFADHDIWVICDYKKEVIKKYVKAFASSFDAKVIEADGNGTASGIGKVISSITDDEPVIVFWCDLLFGEDFQLPDALLEKNLNDNFIGLSGSFVCRWSFEDGQFVHFPSSAKGVAGFFVFKNKQELFNVPEDGPFVPWLKEQNVNFKPFYLEGVSEIGTKKVFDHYSKPSVCRPFNEVTFNEETVTKRGITEQGQTIGNFEKNWYRHVSNLNFSGIPKVYSYNPLVIERIKGRNVWEYNCLTLSEKKSILDKLIQKIQELHRLEDSIPANMSDLEENYINKTFSRLEKVIDLVPFAKQEFIKINGHYYKNIFFDKERVKAELRKYYPQEFCLIHGDCTFSNILYDRVNQKVFLIDPRGYFGKTELYGDPDYDWAKLYYSLSGDYDQFNRKAFALSIEEDSVEMAILSNNWSDIEDYFFDSLPQVNRRKIKLLHSIIWLSLTTYAWEDYDSICGAFYNGVIKSAEFL